MVQARSTCLLEKAVPWWAFVWPSCPAVSIRLTKLSCGEYSFDQAVLRWVFVWSSCPAEGIRLTKLSGRRHSFDQAVRRWAFVWLSCPAVSIRLNKLYISRFSLAQLSCLKAFYFWSAYLSEGFLLRYPVFQKAFDWPAFQRGGGGDLLFTRLSIAPGIYLTKLYCIT